MANLFKIDFEIIVNPIWTSELSMSMVEPATAWLPTYRDKTGRFVAPIVSYVKQFLIGEYIHKKLLENYYITDRNAIIDLDCINQCAIMFPREEWFRSLDGKYTYIGFAVRRYILPPNILRTTL